ncbi:Uncharacterized protein ToN1_04270 [Aromatoleum petrolei]|nr:Uncharacterized protein ToN1_04270 [Aromatoleum petrolei]
MNFAWRAVAPRGLVEMADRGARDDFSYALVVVRRVRIFS